MKLPEPVPENSTIAVLRQHARAINRLRLAIQAREIRESPTTRVERMAHGVAVHSKGSSETSTASGARWL